MSTIKRSTGTGTGNWVTVPDGTAMKRSTGTGTGNWSTVNGVYRSTGTGTGNWTQIWSKSDPITYTRNVDWSWAYKEAGAQVDYSVDGALDDGDWIVGDWGGTWSWNDTSTLVGLKDAFPEISTRPVVKSGSIRFQARNGAEPTSIRFDMGTFNDTGSKPATRTWAANNVKQAVDLTPNALSSYIAFNASMITGLNSDGLGISMRHDAGDTTFRGWGDGVVGTPISVKLELDYV